MKAPGTITLLRVPQTDLREGKLRPVLLMARLPGEYDDWIVCMISSRLDREVKGFDDLIGPDDPDYAKSGLRSPSVIRIGRMAVVTSEMMPGMIGSISKERLQRILSRLRELFSLGPAARP